MTLVSRALAKRRWMLPAAFIVGGALLLGGWRLRTPSITVPIATLTRGDFIDSLQLRGEVKALKPIAITAPAEGGNYQIIKIAGDGSLLQEGDPVVEFDPTSTEQSMAQNSSALKSTEAEIEQVRAQGKLTEQQDLTALIKAQFDVNAARLEASKKEIISKIAGEQAMLALADANERVREAKAKLESHRLATEARVRARKQDTGKAAYELKKAERNLAAMVIRSPQDGTVILEKTVWRPEGWRSPQPGDRLWPGFPIAQISDPSSLRISARVDESERGRLRTGLPVTMQFDAIPDRQLQGRIQSISAITSMNFTAGWPFPKDFSLDVVLDSNDARLRPGMSALLSIEIQRVHNAVVVPSSAVFEASGKPIVYALRGRKFEECAIEVGRRSGDRIMIIRGLTEGDRIALKNPRETAKK